MANTIGFFNSYLIRQWTGGANLSATVRACLLSAGWTPDRDTSDFDTSISAYVAESASGGDAIRQCASPGGGNQVTLSATNVVKFDLSDVVFTASSGVNLDGQYVVLIESTGSIPIAYYEISTASVAATQLLVTWPDPIFETSANVAP